MNYKKEIKIIWGISIVFTVVIGLLSFLYPDNATVCELAIAYPSSYSTAISFCGIIVILKYSGLIFLALSLLLLPLFFLKEKVYRNWKRFSCWYVPIAGIILSTIPLGSGFMQIGREDSSFFFFFLYILISIIMMIYKTIRLRGKL